MKQEILIIVFVLLIVATIVLVCVYPIYNYGDNWVKGHEISYYLVNDTKDTVFIKDENTPERLADDSVIKSKGYKIDTDQYDILPSKDTTNYFTLSAAGSLHFKFLFTYYRFFEPPPEKIYVKYQNKIYTVSLENQRYYTHSSEKDTIRFFLHLNNLALR